MSGINTCFKVIFSENNFQHAAGIFKLSERDLSACVGGLGPVWGKMRMKRGRDQYDFESNNIKVIAAVCLQQTRNWMACMGKALPSFFFFLYSCHS